MAILYTISKLIGADSHQLTFLVCQLLAICCGYIFRVHLSPHSPAGTAKRRHFFELVVGIFLLYLGYGSNIIHLFLQAIPAYLMLVILPLSVAQYGILIFSMVYLSGVHLHQYLTQDFLSVDISAPLMVQTQKLSSLAFNINDGAKLAAGMSISSQHVLNAINRRPRLLQLGSYLFCFHNCMIGPFGFFADYMRFIEGKEHDRLANPDQKQRFIEHQDQIRGAKTELIYQLKLLLLHTILTIWAFTHFKPSHLLDDQFARKSYIQKFIFVMVAGFAFRQRFYFAWTIGCVANLAAGFGFSGFDDYGQARYDFATNIHFFRIELGTSTKAVVDAWNTATTRWLRDCIYDRVPKKYAVWSVFITSALWHGFHPGFYLSFLSGALLTLAGRASRRYLRPCFLGSPKTHLVYDIITHVSAMFAMNYLGVAFLLKRADWSIQFWRQMRFLGHLVPISLILMLPCILGKPEDESIPINSPEQTPFQAQ